MLVAPVSLIVKSSCFSLKLFFMVSGTYSDLTSGVFACHTRFTPALLAVSIIRALAASCTVTAQLADLPPQLAVTVQLPAA